MPVRCVRVIGCMCVCVEGKGWVIHTEDQTSCKRTHTRSCWGFCQCAKGMGRRGNGGACSLLPPLLPLLVNAMPLQRERRPFVFIRPSMTSGRTCIPICRALGHTTHSHTKRTRHTLSNHRPPRSSWLINIFRHKMFTQNVHTKHHYKCPREIIFRPLPPLLQHSTIQWVAAPPSRPALLGSARFSLCPGMLRF